MLRLLCAPLGLRFGMVIGRSRRMLIRSLIIRCPLCQCLPQPCFCLCRAQFRVPSRFLLLNQARFHGFSRPFCFGQARFHGFSRVILFGQARLDRFSRVILFGQARLDRFSRVILFGQARLDRFSRLILFARRASAASRARRSSSVISIGVPVRLDLPHAHTALPSGARSQAEG